MVMAAPLFKLRQIQYFCALAETRSFVKAAQTCNVTQSTLSAGIKELEDALGLKLIDRTLRALTLTPFGKEMAAEGKALLMHAEKIAARAKSMDDPFSGTLRLGIIPTIAPYTLAHILPAMTKAYPRLRVQIYEDLTARLITRMESGEIDAALIAFPYKTLGLETMPLFKEKFVAACPENMFKGKEVLSRKDIQGARLLLLEDGHCLRDHAIEACSLIPSAEWGAFGATSLPTLIEMVRHGYGMTLLPEMAVRASGLPPDITLLPLAAPAPTREIGMAWRRAGIAAPLIKPLGKVIKTALLQ